MHTTEDQQLKNLTVGISMTEKRNKLKQTNMTKNSVLEERGNTRHSSERKYHQWSPGKVLPEIGQNCSG